MIEAKAGGMRRDRLFLGSAAVVLAGLLASLASPLLLEPKEEAVASPHASREASSLAPAPTQARTDPSRGTAASAEPQRPSRPGLDRLPGEAEPRELSPEEAEELLLRRQLRLGNRGLIALRGGEPASGVWVQVYDARLLGGTPHAQGATGPDGSIAFDSLPGRPIFVLGRGEVASISARGGLVELEPEGASLVEGVVLGPEREPVQAKIELWAGTFLLGATHSDAQGAFRLTHRSLGPGVLLVSAPGYQPLRTSLSRLRLDGGISLTRGSEGSLSGRVLDGSGAALPGAVVRVAAGGREGALATTDHRGQFSFAHLPTGQVSLEVHHEGLVPLALASALVDSRGSEPVEIRLAGQGRLSVLVHKGRVPVSGVEVRVVDPAVTRFGTAHKSAAEQVARTDARGLCAFDLPPGAYFVRVAVEGTLRTAEAVVVAKRDTSVEVDQALARRLVVKVVDTQGSPVPGVFMDVSLPGINWEGMPSARTNAEGIAEFKDLPAGRAEVHLGGPDGQWRMVRTEGEEAEFVWTSPTSFLLRGDVLSGQSSLLAVSVFSDVAWIEEVRAVAGKVEVELTPPSGPQELFLVPADEALAPFRVPHDEHGQPREFSAAFLPAGSIRGRLVRDGQGVGGRVRLGGAWGAVHEARSQWATHSANDEWITVNEWDQASGTDGLFVLQGLPAGELTLEFEAIGCAPGLRQFTIKAGESLDLGAVSMQAR